MKTFITKLLTVAALFVAASPAAAQFQDDDDLYLRDAQGAAATYFGAELAWCELQTLDQDGINAWINATFETMHPAAFPAMEHRLEMLARVFETGEARAVVLPGVAESWNGHSDMLFVAIPEDLRDEENPRVGMIVGDTAYELNSGLPAEAGGASDNSHDCCMDEDELFLSPQCEPETFMPNAFDKSFAEPVFAWGLLVSIEDDECIHPTGCDD